MDLFIVCNLILFVLVLNEQNYLYGDTTSLADNSIQRRINDFRQYCPYTRLCNGSANEIPHSSTNSWKRSCCLSCDCGNDCGLDCCPDRSAHFESEEDMYYIKNVIQCVVAQYSPDRHGSVQSFLMVSRCPYGYTDFEIAAKCERENSEVAFSVPLRYILPGYDNYTRLIYKNIFCARCHNVQENTLEFFRLELACSLDSQKIIYVTDIVQCNILFKTPDVFPLYQKSCYYGTIRRCNVTGQWEMYDKYLEEACLSYTSVYENFRNVHCFLCNGFNASDIGTSCEDPMEGMAFSDTSYISGFITALDWSKEQPTMLGSGPPNEEVDCLQSIIFNVSRADKWFTFCPDGMLLQNNTCIFPYFDSPLYIITEINLILEPKFVSEDTNKYTMTQILTDVVKETQKVMSLLISKDLLLYKVIGFVAFKKNMNNLHQKKVKVHMKSVQSIELKIQILKYLSRKMDHVATVIDFALVLTNISDFGYFKARFRHFDSGYVLDEWPSVSCSASLEQRQYELCIHSLRQTNKVLYFQISRTNLHTPINMSYYIIAAEPEPFCPRVALPKLCNESLVKNIYSNIFLNKKLSVNRTHLFFCYQDYIQHLVSLDIEFDERETVPLANTRVLFYLTIACLIPSLIRLVLTLTVYSFCPILRTLPGLNNMALVSSLILFQTIALLNTVFRIDLLWVCAFVGVFTHFSLILSFAWMFVCTLHMLNAFVKIRNLNVARNAYKTFLSYTAFTIGVAVTAVILAVSVAMVQSMGSDIGYGGNSCYIKKQIMIIFFVAVPVAMVTLMNIVMFGVVVFKIRKSPVLASSNIQERNNIKIFVKLSTITGMTWVFGFIYIFTHLDTFAYIFIVLNAGQGVFIMLSFICNRRVLNLLLKKSTKTSTVPRLTTSTSL